MTYFMVLVVLSLSQASLADDFFPDEEWRDHPKTQQVLKSSSCANFYNYSFAVGNKTWHRTDSVVVIKDGLKIFEMYSPRETPDVLPNDYFGKYNHDTPHILWSASKSITGTIMGAALQQGLFGSNIRTRLADEESWSPDHKEKWFSPAIRADLRKKINADKDLVAGGYEQITIEDLLYMQSGFAWDESYGSGMSGSNVINMVYTDGIDNMVAYTISRPMAFNPGERWQYASGNSSLLMGMIYRHELGSGKPDADAKKAPWRLLFEPLQMKNAVFEPDNSGTFVGSSYVYLRPVDMAKVGYLYLKQGNWKGKQLLPNDWVSKSSDFAPAYKLPKTIIGNATFDGVYGMTWWLNKSLRGLPNKPQDEVDHYTGKLKNQPNAYADIPTDFYGAFGHYGQYIFVLPSWNLVIVRTADDRDPKVFDVNKWLGYAKLCFVENPILN